MSVQNTNLLRAFNLTGNKLYGFLKGALNSENEALEILEKTYIDILSRKVELTDEVLTDVLCTKAMLLCLEKIGQIENVELSPEQDKEIQIFFNACENLDPNVSPEAFEASGVLEEPLRNLNLTHRIFIYLRLYCGKSISDIANLAKCSEVTAKSVMYDAYSAIMPNVAMVCRCVPALQGYPVLQLLNAAVLKQYQNAFFADADKSLERVGSVLSLAPPVATDTIQEPPVEPTPAPVQPAGNYPPFGTGETNAMNNPIAPFDEEHPPATAQQPGPQPPVNYPVWERIASSFAYTCIPEATASLAEAFELIVSSPFEARMMFQSIVERFPNEAYAYLGLLMLDVGASDISQLRGIPVNYRTIPSFNYTYYYGDVSIKSFLDQIAGNAIGQAQNNSAINNTPNKKGTALKAWGIIAIAAQVAAAGLFIYHFIYMF